MNADATRAALEAALLDNPDDLVTRMAYADHLHEQGDPRGEFIQVQLALEEPGRSADERRTLRAREKALLKAHDELNRSPDQPAAAAWPGGSATHPAIIHLRSRMGIDPGSNIAP